MTTEVVDDYRGVGEGAAGEIKAMKVRAVHAQAPLTSPTIKLKHASQLRPTATNNTASNFANDQR